MDGPKSNGWWEAGKAEEGHKFPGEIGGKMGCRWGRSERGIRVNNNGTRHTRNSPAQQAMEKAHRRMRSRTMATYFQSSAN